MGWVSGIATFAVVWWLVIFMVLPFGNAASVDGDEIARGQARGAPKRPRLLIKAAITTAITAVIWVIIYVVIQAGWISFRN